MTFIYTVFLKRNNNLFFIVTGLFLFFLVPNVDAQHSTEKVDFTVRTTTPGGSYSPKNIGAIWIEDESGNFVKTLKLWADRRKQYLYTWNSRTSGNTTDAVTGATVSSHQTHTASWDVKDVNGAAMPNGTYTLKIEMTDKHAQGPMASFNFPVGEATNTLSFADESNFHDIELSWTSVATSVSNNTNVITSFQLEQNYPNPFNPTTAIRYALAQDSQIELSVYNSSGQLVSTLVNQHQAAGIYQVQFDASDLTSGLYFYKISTPQFNQSRKMLLVR
jgi:hypothetical protein